MKGGWREHQSLFQKDTMKIKGLQKTTLIDYPGEIACTLFLFGCNFKCGFCHNPELVIKEGGVGKTKEEVLSFLQKRKRYLGGVCITGGEPLLTLEKDFLEDIKELGYKIKLDTNGSFPEKLEELIQEGLVDFVSMDIKSSKDLYPNVSGIGETLDINKIEKSIKLISQLDNHEFRTTIVEDIHTIENMKELAKWMNEVIGSKPKKYTLQGFKNQDKFIDEAYKSKRNTPTKFLEDIKDAIKDYFEEVEIRI